MKETRFKIGCKVERKDGVAGIVGITNPNDSSAFPMYFMTGGETGLSPHSGTSGVEELTLTGERLTAEEFVELLTSAFETTGWPLPQGLLEAIIKAYEEDGGANSAT